MAGDQMIDEDDHAPGLEDPTAQAVGYAEALAGLVRSQQKRIEVLIHEIDRLDGVIASLEIDLQAAQEKNDG